MRTALIVALTLTAGPASAFSYPEHFVITRHALAAAVETSPGARAVLADAGAYFTGTPMSLAPPDTKVLASRSVRFGRRPRPRR